MSAKIIYLDFKKSYIFKVPSGKICLSYVSSK